MKRHCRVALLALLLRTASAAAQEQYSFDASEFEKKAFELGGYAQLKQEHFTLNPSGAFYKLSGFGQTRRGELDRTTATVELVGKLRHGIGSFDFRTHSVVQRDQAGQGHDNLLYEAAWSIRPDPGLTIEAGKRALRWGKGYAWNPIGFVDRPKDPNDPDLGREGFVVAGADLIWHREGALQTVAFTPVLVPVARNINGDFGPSGHVNPAAKLYLLYQDTDIDFAWMGKGSRPARYGMDFSRNLASNFEIHGEWARTLNFEKPVTDSAGRITPVRGDATSYLLGLRYLTAYDTTFIAEYYRNGAGYSAAQADSFYQLVDTAYRTGSAGLMQKGMTLSQAGYGRPNAGQRYLYFRAQQKDAFGIVYFQPSLTAMLNLDDRSYQVTPELQYSGVNNLELRMRLFLLHGGASTDFGEKQNSKKLELYVKYHF